MTTDTQRMRFVFANFEQMRRQDLIEFCQQMDPNGCYTDEAAERELGEPATVEDLRAIVRAWKEDFYAG